MHTGSRMQRVAIHPYIKFLQTFSYTNKMRTRKAKGKIAYVCTYIESIKSSLISLVQQIR